MHIIFPFKKGRIVQYLCLLFVRKRDFSILLKVRKWCFDLLGKLAI